MGTGAGMKPTPGRIWRQLPPEAWLSDGRQVLHFRPSRWDRWCQQLELITGERLDGQPPLLRHRRILMRSEALALWAEKRKLGWRPCEPQWSLPPREVIR